MNTSNNNNLNLKSQIDNTDYELGSFNEDEEHNLFMNRKELVHIEDDTSINVDKSYDDDHSKSSTLKKGFIINNISAINEQFVPNNQLNQKKFENELHDVSEDSNISENGVDNYPLMMAGRMIRNNNNNEEQIHMNMDGNEFDFNNENDNENENNDINNNMENNNNEDNYNNILQHIKTKTEYNNYFRNQNENFLHDFSSPKKKTVKNYIDNRTNIEIEDIEDEDEEEDENETNQKIEEKNNNTNNNSNNNNNNNNNFESIQMMLQKPFVPQNSNKSRTLEPNAKNINLNDNPNNNSENKNNFMLNQIAINPTQNINSNNNNKPLDNLNNKIFTISSFDHCYLGSNLNKFFGSVNTSGQTFGMAHSIDFQNKYNQLEAKYNILFEQNKKLEAECEELKNSDRGVLDMLTYWQNFYLEILEIVLPKKSKNNDNGKNDYLDDPYRIQTINEVKKLVLISRDKAYNNFYKSQPIQFDIKGEPKEIKEIKEIKEVNSSNSNKDINKNLSNNNNSFNKSIHNSINNCINNLNNDINYVENWNKKIIYSKNESFSFVENDLNKKKKKKFLDEDDDLDFLPPIRHIEKINTGINTDITGDNFSKPIVKEVIKEVTVIQQIPLKKYDYNKLSISKSIKDYTLINIKPRKIQTPNFDNQSSQSKNTNANKDILIKAKPKPNKINNKNKQQESNGNNININSSRNFNELRVSQSMKISYKGLPPKTPKKFKKNILHKIAIVQTDMTAKNISSIETLNKACSSQLLNSQREKEKMQKLYDDKISSLNEQINELNKTIKQNEAALKEKIEKNNNNTINNDKNGNSNDNTIKINDKNINNNNVNSNANNNNNINTESSTNNLNSSFIFLPEMIPPENTYKIFIHCVKHFKYEEEIYKKYLEEEDLFTLKSFVSKMEKYLVGTSLPVLKEGKKKAKKKEKNEKEKEKEILSNIDYDYSNQDVIQKKIKETIITDNKPPYLNVRTKARATTSDKKNADYRCNSVYSNNNNTFNKYKAAIMTLKNY